MILVEFIYCVTRKFKKALIKFTFDIECSKCKGSDGNCMKCKYHPEAHNIPIKRKKNLFKRDWDKVYMNFIERGDSL